MLQGHMVHCVYSNFHVKITIRHLRMLSCNSENFKLLMQELIEHLKRIRRCLV